MAEIVFGIAEKIVTDLGSLALQEVGSAIGVKKDLKKLEKTVSTIKALLLHAEEKQLNDNQVKQWLRRIKDVAYEADDVIDDFAFEALCKKLRIQDNIPRMVRNFFSSSNPVVFRFKMASRIKAIRESFKEIEADSKSFHLETRVEEKRVYNSGREQTHSYVVEENVIGREVDKENIVKLLLDANEQESVSVIAIQGMGGLGKTTLAQMVYNNERVVRIFEREMWVCVGEEFDVKKISEKIIKSATDSECPNLEMDQLQSRLRKELGGKRFLLVLDDIWNEDVFKWEKLKDLLMGGAMGSKIIVTTRSVKVFSIMGRVSTYQLGRLSEDNCWNLFKSRAFKAGQDQAHPEFVEEIGKDIVRKCGGVPLAAKTLGSLLFLKTKKQEWEDVRSNHLWRLSQNENDVLPALRISYNHLPFYLRQCFAYCSIFPKDHEIEKEMLIQFWIAHGFIHLPGANRSLEDIGNEYVEELMWRSFFQEPEVDYYENLKSFKMHDLVHDLAKSVAGVEYFTVFKDTKENLPEGVRHLCCFEESSSLFETSGVAGKAPNLRTLVFTSEIACSVDYIFSSFKFLRVLVFESGDIESLPNSIGKLKHLRFLEISCPKIKTLPKSITNLLSLRSLELLCCEKLKKLPENIKMMVNLKHICIEGCLSLSYLPLGLEELISLQTLSVFIVGKGGIGCELNELNGLKNLGGKLTIKNLENVRNAAESAKANLKGKQNLEVLNLLWNQVDDEGVNGGEIAFDVLGNLEPHGNLKSLEVEGFRGTIFPRWMMEPSLPNVVEVTLKKCRKCEQVPPFGKLPSLEVLKLEGMDGLQFAESSSLVRRRREWFPSLKKLSLCSVPNLESWVTTPEKEECLFISFPSLVELEIDNCPKLENMPLLPAIEKLVLKKCNGKLVHSLLQPGKKLGNSLSNSSLVTLKSLEIRECYGLECLPEDGLQGLTSLLSLHVTDCESLTSLSAGMRYLTVLETLEIRRLPKLAALPYELLQNATSLQSLDIYDCSGLIDLPESVGNLTMLRTLEISGCDKLQCLPDGMQHLTSLQSLYISECSKLQCLPDGMQHLTSLQRLDIYYCSVLIDLPASVGNLTMLRTLEILGCSKLQCLPDGMQHLTSLQSLDISQNDSLMSWPSGLGKLTSLRSLTISCPSNLPFLPEEIQHLTALQELGIYNSVLMSLPEWMVNLTSLQTLYIWNCPNIQFLPEWMSRLASLRHLYIGGCPDLTSRCRKVAGEDWPKIAHVKRITVDHQTIQNLN